DDKHKGQEGKKCETCHVETSWKDVDKFNHNRMSTFPLLGKHSLVTCKKCHAAPTFKDAKSDCWSCHEKDDEKVHKRRLGTECQVCHSTRAWGAWDFDHNKTKFKLDGAHKKTANKCYACHSKPMSKKVILSETCGSCHAREDVHNGNFGDRCERCHEGNDWKSVKMGATAR
ncbi:MAG: cytochrome C, partial [Sideroxyarcus sp.]|nr:cytochrome C [Sideroxyarcus sp.]